MRPIVYMSRATLDNEQNWTPMELEAGCVVWSIRRLRRYLFGVYFPVFTDHQCLQQICKMGKTKPRIQRWMKFLSVYNFRLSYRRGQANDNDDFLSRLPLPPIEEDISGASALTDPDNLGVYLIRACGFITPSCPVPGVGLGRLATSPYHTPGAGLGGLVPPPGTPVLGGLPLTKDDFRTHRAPMPSTHMTARPRRPYATLLKAPYTTYAISARDEALRSTRRTRSQTAMLGGNAPSRPDYRKAAHSGFATSATPPPPLLRTSPPPRSARLGSTTSTGRFASTSSTPTPSDLQSDSPPPTAPLHPSAPDPDVQAAAAYPSNTLLNYSHRPNSPGVAVSVDYFGPLPTTARGNSYILLFTDRFSRRADMFAVTTAEFTAEGTANILVNRFIPLWGCPSTLLSDNGPRFCARLATAVYKLLGIHKLTTSAYHPSGNGGVERVNHTMAQMLAMVCNEHQNDWGVHLP